MTTNITKNNEQSLAKQTEEKEKSWTTPPVDILENANEYLLIADFPGVRAEDIKVELHNGELSVKAPQSYGRTFRMPSGIQGDKINAELKLGVLKLHIPKEEAKKPRQIPVSVS